MRTANYILGFSMVLLMVSCGGTDSEYTKLLPRATTNPPTDAIVGMWHRKGHIDLGGSSSSSMYCRKDGAILRDINMTGFLVNEQIEDVSGDWTWHYQGGGVWHPKLKGVHYGEEWRLADGELLTRGYTDAFGLMWYHQVFERVAR